MSGSFILCDRDQEILVALTQKVRILGLRQVADHWYGSDRANARRRLRILVAAGMLTRATVLARPLPVLLTPLATWMPGEPIPDAGVISNRLKSRWRKRPVRRCRVVLATPRAAQLLGSNATGVLTRSLQSSHDLGVAAVWLHFDRTDPDRAAAWRGEDVMAHTRRGEKCPDAFLVDARGEVQSVIEFGGDYGPERVRAFQLDCEDRRLPYEIW
jgi:hypothetical protein